MKREVAWEGFYSNLKKYYSRLNEIETSRGTKNVQLWEKRDKMVRLNCIRYAKSLVIEHGWQDIHTEQFVRGAL